jgi:GH24 family phage-related lysozyme (muramidase)
MITHIQLKKLEMDDPRARIRVVLICCVFSRYPLPKIIYRGLTSAGYSHGYDISEFRSELARRKNAHNRQITDAQEDLEDEHHCGGAECRWLRARRKEDRRQDEAQ